MCTRITHAWSQNVTLFGVKFNSYMHTHVHVSHMFGLKHVHIFMKLVPLTVERTV